MKHAHPLTSASCSGVDSGEMEVQNQGDGEEEEKWKDRLNLREEEQAERRTESTIHTVPELLLDTMQVETNLLLSSITYLLLLLCLTQIFSGHRTETCVFVFVFAESRERSRGDQEGDGAAVGGLEQTGSWNSGGGESEFGS